MVNETWTRASDQPPPQGLWLLLKAPWRDNDQWSPFIVVQASGGWWLDERRQTLARINRDDLWCPVGPL